MQDNEKICQTTPQRGKNGFKYKPKWAVIIPCSDESKQKQTYERLRDLGYKCRVVNV